MAFRSCVFFAALPLAWAAQDELSTALSSDDQCSGEAEGNCSVAMLQLRGQQASEASSGQHGGSCKAYGCKHSYHSWMSCQCNKGCERFGNCCSDYEDKCNAPLPANATCRVFGCGISYSSHLPCQCNSACASHSSCCPDYSATCLGQGPAPSPNGGPSSGHIAGHPSTDKTYPKYDGFTLSLVEEFDAPIDLDSDPIWTWSDGGLIEGQIRFVKEAISFRNGKMRITASTRQYPTQNCSNAEVGDIDPKDMTSGELRTKHNMFRYGRYEASIRAPTVQPSNPYVDGNYVSTMFVFRDAKYKHWREIDIELTGDHSDAITTNVLSADNTKKWSADIAESKGFRVGKNLRQSFHTLAIEWLPDRISWYFDGKLIREKAGGHVPIPDLSGKIMMNLWMFDERALFGGKEIWNNRYPMYSEYDWFRFYKWDGDSNYPCKGFSTSCLTSDDQYLSSNNPCDGIQQVGTVYGKAPCKASCQRR